MLLNIEHFCDYNNKRLLGVLYSPEWANSTLYYWGATPLVAPRSQVAILSTNIDRDKHRCDYHKGCMMFKEYAN